MYGPDWLVLGVNNTCNLHCKMCDVGTQNNTTVFATNLVGTRPLHMPLELIQKVYDQAALYFPTARMGYAFTEPLVYKHLEESLEYAQQKKLKTSITTNALNLKKKAASLVEFGVENVFISLDGPQDIHNSIRGHQRSFQKAIEGIEQLLEYDNPPAISVFCVITEWNIGHLKTFVDYFKAYPIKQLGFMHTNFTPSSIADAHNLLFGSTYRATQSNTEEIDINNFDLDVLLEEIHAIKKDTYSFNVSFSPELETAEKLNTFYHRPDVFMGKGCSDAFSNIMIKSDGSVIPAHGRCYNLKAGNLYEQNLKEVWNAKPLAKFRKDLNKVGGLMPACSRCCSAF